MLKVSLVYLSCSKQNKQQEVTGEPEAEQAKKPNNATWCAEAPASSQAGLWKVPRRAEVGHNTRTGEASKDKCTGARGSPQHTKEARIIIRKQRKLATTAKIEVAQQP